MTKRYLPVKDNPNLVKDMDTGAVININKKEIQKRRQYKEKIREEREKINKIDKLEEDIDEIKSLLHQLIGKSNGS